MSDEPRGGGATGARRRDRVEPPLVSVGLASRNGARYLPAALASLAAQTYPRIEVVAVDDGSTDATGEILEAFAASRPGVRFFRTPGVGLAGALARAFAVASGDLFARQDDDDLSHRERIERQVDFLRAHPEVALVGTAAEVIDEEGRSRGAYPVPIGSRAIRRALGRKSPFVHGSILMRRDAYRAAGGYRAVFTTVEDFDLYLRLPGDAVLANLPEALYSWRRHAGNRAAQIRPDRFYFHAVARAFDDERRRTGGDSAALLERARDAAAFQAAYPDRGRLLAYLGETYARVGRLREAERHLLRALRSPGARARALLWCLLSPAVALAWRARRGAGGSP